MLHVFNKIKKDFYDNTFINMHFNFKTAFTLIYVTHVLGSSSDDKHNLTKGQ